MVAECVDYGCVGLDAGSDGGLASGSISHGPSLERHSVCAVTRCWVFVWFSTRSFLHSRPSALLKAPISLSEPPLPVGGVAPAAAGPDVLRLEHLVARGAHRVDVILREMSHDSIFHEPKSAPARSPYGNRRWP